ncbi:MAG: long-chain-acyl-CoA synthetase [Pseudomonadales bacterium]|nr:long-chain-acyl-CoA synthetase [Pseudomonadales bacterium]
MEKTISGMDLFRQRKYLLNSVGSLCRFAFLKATKLKKNTPPLSALVELNAERQPDHRALFYQDQSLTYKELNDYCNQVAHYLLSKNVKQRDVVILFMENRIEFLIMLIALSKIGAVVGLINTSLVGNGLKHCIDLVKPTALIIGEELCDQYEAIVDANNADTMDRTVFYMPDSASYTTVAGEREGFINLSQEAQNFSKENLNIEVDIDDSAWYIYTSGTTGLPKATVQTYAKTATASYLAALINPVTRDDTVYCTLPLYHGAALLSWFSTLIGGGTFALRRKFSASEFWDDIEQYQATIFSYVGELCRYLLNSESPKSENNTLRAIVGNGLRPDLWLEFKERFQIDEVRELYGASESNIASLNLFNMDKTTGLLFGPYAIVKYDEETEEPILDNNGHVSRVEPGNGGLLLGRLTKLVPFTGYTDKSKNKGKLIHNALKEGDSWFNTGDIVREIGCRHMQFLDRSGDTFRWKGENVSTSEVETVVNHFPGVEESVVYGVEVPHATGRAGMVAIKLEKTDEDIDGKAFYEYLAGQLPNYAMPLFVRVNETLERTGTFKYKKFNLKQEGYEPEKVKSAIRVALHSEKCYTTLDSSLIGEIKDNKIKL